MSARNRPIRDGATASSTNENLNQVEVQEGEVPVTEPRTTRNSRLSRRGRARGRASGRVGRPRNPVTTNAPMDNLSEQISRILMNTLPEMIRQVFDSQREKENERLSKEAEGLRSRIIEETRKREEELRSRLDEENRKHEEDLC